MSDIIFANLFNLSSNITFLWAKKKEVKGWERKGLMCDKIEGKEKELGEREKGMGMRKKEWE